MPLMTAPQMPKAAARSLPWKSEFTDDRVDGNTSAPPTPWTVREAMREPGPDAVAASRDPPTNRTTPAVKVVRRPIRSPRRPAPSRRAAKMTLYMALTHWASVRFRLRAEIIVGRATPTIVPSKMMRRALQRGQRGPSSARGWAGPQWRRRWCLARHSFRPCRHYEGDDPSASAKRLKTSPAFSPSGRRQWHLLASYS